MTLDEGLAAYRKAEGAGAVLLDVRTRGEYRDGHVTGAANLPLDEIGDVAALIPGKDTPVYLYCRSGARSGAALEEMKEMGYRHLENIGGMMSYHGAVERG